MGDLAVPAAVGDLVLARVSAGQGVDLVTEAVSVIDAAAPARTLQLTGVR